MMPSKNAVQKVKNASKVITFRKSAYEGLEQKGQKDTARITTGQRKMKN